VSEDRVRLEDQERLDKPDADALQELVYTYVREAFGGLLGNASGLLSPLAWTEQNDGATFLLSLDKLVLCHLEDQGTRVEDRGIAGAVNVGAKWGSVVYSFDPADAGHVNHPIDYTAARGIEAGGPGGTKPYIWARPYGVPSDVDTRRVWNVATGAEVATPVQTRTRQRMEFEISAAAPVQGAGLPWVAIARVWTWGVGPVPSVIYGLSAWDDSDLHALCQDPGDVEDPDTDNASMAWPLQRLLESTAHPQDGTVNDWPSGTQRSAGLLYHLHWFRSRFQRHVSGGTNDPVGTIVRPWWSVPEISLNGAWDMLEDHAASLVLHLNNLNVHDTEIKQNAQRHEILCSGVIQFRPAGAFPAPDNTAGWARMHGWGIESVTGGANESEVILRFKPSLVAGRTTWYVSGVQATPMYGPGILGDPSGFILSAEMIPDAWSNPTTFAASGAGTLASYEATTFAGGAVGLGAGEHGVLLHVSQLRTDAAAADDVKGTAPANGIMPSVSAWHVTVHISKYKADEVGV